MLPIYFAPIQGYTDAIYRRVHHNVVGGVEGYYTPFVRVESNEIRNKDLRDIATQNNSGLPIIPQIIFNGRKEFEYLVDKIEALGYKQIDLNMGCPFPLQVRHRRGSGILSHPDIIEDIIESIKEHRNIEFSVKMRLGWDNDSECEQIIALLNNIDLQHITLHPRTGIQQYKGSVDKDKFRVIYEMSHNPLIYNGDIQTTDQIRLIEEEFPRLKGVMIGRSLLGCPSLATEYRQQCEWTNSQRINRMLEMHTALISEYSRILQGDAQILNKMHTFWEYSEQLIGRKSYKKVMKSGNLKNYFVAVNELLKA